MKCWRYANFFLCYIWHSWRLYLNNNTNNRRDGGKLRATSPIRSAEAPVTRMLHFETIIVWHFPSLEPCVVFLITSQYNDCPNHLQGIGLCSNRLCKIIEILTNTNGSYSRKMSFFTNDQFSYVIIKFVELKSPSEVKWVFRQKYFQPFQDKLLASQPFTDWLIKFENKANDTVSTDHAKKANSW